MYPPAGIGKWRPATLSYFVLFFGSKPVWVTVSKNKKLKNENEKHKKDRKNTTHDLSGRSYGSNVLAAASFSKWEARKTSKMVVARARLVRILGVGSVQAWRPHHCAKYVIRIDPIKQFGSMVCGANPSIWSVVRNGIHCPSTRNRKAWTSVTYPSITLGMHEANSCTEHLTSGPRRRCTPHYSQEC